VCELEKLCEKLLTHNDYVGDACLDSCCSSIYLHNKSKKNHRRIVKFLYNFLEIEKFCVKLKFEIEIC